MANALTGYCNGSNMLLYLDGKAIGHCSTHTAEFNSETKDRAVKPAAKDLASTGLFKGKTVVGLNISISADSFVFHEEDECGFKELFAAWKSGKSVTCKCMERKGGATAYLEGKFVITSLKRTDPASDDTTCSISLENDGEPTTMDETAITQAPAA